MNGAANEGSVARPRPEQNPFGRQWPIPCNGTIVDGPMREQVRHYPRRMKGGAVAAAYLLKRALVRLSRQHNSGIRNSEFARTPVPLSGLADNNPSRRRAAALARVRKDRSPA